MRRDIIDIAFKLAITLLLIAVTVMIVSLLGVVVMMWIEG